MDDPSSTYPSTALTRAVHELCGDPAFSASDRLRHLLRYLATEAATRRSKKITQRDIAIDVLGLGSSFDPSIDAHVRIEVMRLRQALSAFYGDHPDRLAVRIEIPKGSYHPRIALPPPLPAARGRIDSRSQPDRVAVAPFVVSESGLVEAAESALLSTLERCSASPLVRSGYLQVCTVAARCLDDAVGAARSIGAAAVLHGRICRKSDGFRVLVILVETERAALLKSQVFEAPDGETLDRMIDRAAALGATWCSDPLVGIVPKILASRTTDSVHAACLAAFAYMSSQRPQDLLLAIDAIEQARTAAGRPIALLDGLRIDMTRAGANMGLIAGCPTSADCLELSEAVLLDHGTGCPSTQLARGYALLNAARVEEAAEVARAVLGSVQSPSLRSDAAMLLALSDDGMPDAELPDLAGGADGAEALFMDDCRGVIAAIRTGRAADACDILEGNRHPDSLWHHVLASASLAQEGDLRNARRRSRMIERIWPDFPAQCTSAVSGFFPEPHVKGFLIEGLAKARA